MTKDEQPRALVELLHARRKRFEPTWPMTDDERAGLEEAQRIAERSRESKWITTYSEDVLARAYFVLLGERSALREAARLVVASHPYSGERMSDIDYYVQQLAAVLDDTADCPQSAPQSSPDGPAK